MEGNLKLICWDDIKNLYKKYVNAYVQRIIREFGCNSEPCGSFETILTHKLPIIHQDLPVPTRDLNSSLQPEFLNPKSIYKSEKALITPFMNSFFRPITSGISYSPFLPPHRGGGFSDFLYAAVGWWSICPVVF